MATLKQRAVWTLAAVALAGGATTVALASIPGPDAASGTSALGAVDALRVMASGELANPSNQLAAAQAEAISAITKHGLTTSFPGVYAGMVAESAPDTVVVQYDQRAGRPRLDAFLAKLRLAQHEGTQLRIIGRGVDFNRFELLETAKQLAEGGVDAVALGLTQIEGTAIDIKAGQVVVYDRGAAARLVRVFVTQSGVRGRVELPDAAP